MSKCEYCKHFQYVCKIQILNKAPNEIALGFCMMNERKYGNQTLSINNACDDYEYNQPKYNRGDVFVGNNEVITITEIQHQYNPLIYRVTNNYCSTCSRSEKMIDKEYKQIFIAKGD